MEQTAQSSETLLSAARDQIKFIRETREKGDLTKIEPSTIQELMCYLIPLVKSNPTADTLENICAAAIKYHELKLLQSYYELVKQIIEVGETL